jgi:chromosome segregation ATPase
MARTHSSYTASPTRWRSPQRSPARQPTSEEGSQYEMDLDALGLNSTFDSTEMDEQHKPKVDVVDTSDIEGPDDFTMNMTYWMTADLSAQQKIRSRKEANVKVDEVRGDAPRDLTEGQDTTGEGDRAVVEESSRDRGVEAEMDSASPTMRANGTAGERSSRKAPSEASMENDEKVRSYLSALPDTDIGEDALTSTPLRVPKQNMLQVPSPSATKARSLQPTVEDYDTPRKPTQETVIHHPIERILKTERDDLSRQVAELQARLEQQERKFTTRTTELDTLLQYTRTELETMRSEGYKLKEQAKVFQLDNERQKKELEAGHASTKSQLKAQEDELNAKMQEFGEELRLQGQAKLQNQKADFERQLRALEEAKQAVHGNLEEKDQRLEQLNNEMEQLRQIHEQGMSSRKASDRTDQADLPDLSEERTRMQEKMSNLQTRADELHAALQNANAEARSAHEEAQTNAKLHASATAMNQGQKVRVRDLEARLSSTQFQLDCAQAEASAKEQRTSDLESRVRSLLTQLETVRGNMSENEKQLPSTSDLESRIQSLQRQLDSVRTGMAAKDQQILRHIEEQERYEQRLNSAQGRLESLEGTISTLRQQLADAHRESAKARIDAERFESDFEDATDRLQDVRAEAERRVADMEKKLAKMKELKVEAEARFKELQSQHEELIDDHDTKLEDVREKAEDAVRKAGSLLEQERSEKKRIAKELKKTSHDLGQLRTEIAQKAAAEEDEFSAEESSLLSSSHADAKDTEIENLRNLLRKQSSTIKTLKSETTSLRKESTRLKTLESSSETVAELRSELSNLRRANSTLKVEADAREADFEAVNKAMDERLAAMLSKVLKERAKHVVGKRDGQWAESVGKVSNEKDLMGRVLLREWGRQEVGVAKEVDGEKQRYRYQYVQRS